MTKKPSLADIQAAMHLGGPMVQPPAFMDKTPRAKSEINTEPRKHPEQDLQIACCKYLDTQPRILYWATPNSLWVGKMTPGKMGYLAKQKRMGLKKGIPDLCLFFRNKHGAPTFCWAELKAQKGVVSDEQTNYMEKCNEMGGFTAVVKSIEDLQNLLNVAGY